MSGDESGEEKHILDLSKKKLKKVPKQDDAHSIRQLILDENELQKIDNIDSYHKIETLSLARNQLLRMYGVCRLHCLRELNLSFNGILSIEGLKECIHLRVLNLEGNNVKTIEHLNMNVNLESLNLADNSIGSISDMSFLRNLKELYLHGNRLTHLRQCDKYLPTSLETLTLAKNSINDLNEICTLSHLSSLLSISIADNPCVIMTNSLDGFDYRPFVLNWCMSLKYIDGYVVDPIESLKAEWLYSQGRGRQFRVGEQQGLAKYLSSMCPLVGKALENENDRKLRLILSKAQHHQRQLQEEIMDNANSSASTSPSSHRKKPTSRIQSPRFSRLSGRQGSPESMANSYHGNSSNNSVVSDNGSANHSLQMSISLIENIKNDGDGFSLAGSGMSSSVTTKTYNSTESTPRNITPNPYNDQTFISQTPSGGPLAAASKMVPVPETLMSPDVCPAAVAQRVTVTALNSQLHKSKGNKNKDNKLNLPRVRSPQLKRNQSPTSSPRRMATKCDKVQQQQEKLQTSAVMVDAGGFSTDDDGEQINTEKLKAIRKMAAQKQQQMQQEQLKQQVDNSLNCGDRLIEHVTESSAVTIQKMWRGYHTRKKTNKDIAERLQRRRTQEYIEQLGKDMLLTKAQLENERKIQQLQMQAINALWKKVSTMEVDPKGIPAATEQGEDSNGGGSGHLSLDQNSAAVVNDLAKRCTMLTDQVQMLQSSIGTIVNCLTMVCNLPQDAIKKQAEIIDCSSTQTDLIAVHTPQIEDLTNFPFTKTRPSTLALESKHETLACPKIDELNDVDLKETEDLAHLEQDA
ncbi:centrosomal protein of 97 kDa [Drosophila eugracilis]|uniref:centrosomal protein of 97 kDa n=1 Tax=Drosophila eugracilis TaxID=29029 RepID=UPI0007E6378B|nr:centrosomal protein of 97 kDa [Drosophila eugracilis]